MVIGTNWRTLIVEARERVDDLLGGFHGVGFQMALVEFCVMITRILDHMSASEQH